MVHALINTEDVNTESISRSCHCLVTNTTDNLTSSPANLKAKPIG